MSRLRLNRNELRLFLTLLLGCFFGSLSVIPYLFQLHSVEMDQLPAQIIKTALNTLIVFPVVIYIGILTRRYTPVAGAPLIEGDRRITGGELLTWGVFPGVVSCFLVVLGDFIFRSFGADTNSLNTLAPTAMAGFFASFYGGIVEEVLFRFFFMAVIVLSLKRIGSLGVWLAILTSALVFGMGHLSTVADALGVSTIGEIPQILFFREIALNSVVGIIAGWLYWKKGIEFAIISHFIVDVGLHVILFIV